MQNNADKHRVFVYGTLRPGFTDTVQVPGKLFDLGWYPGIQLTDEGPTVTCEVITVDDAGLERLDRYEGYSKESPETSLYLRKKYFDGYIYEYNGSFENKHLIESGDWLGYRNESAGASACMVA